jgi:hypothetical protein
MDTDFVTTAIGSEMIVLLLLFALFACQLSAGVTAYLMLRDALTLSKRSPFISINPNCDASVRISIVLIGIVVVSALYFWALFDVTEELRKLTPRSLRVKQLIGMIALNVSLLPLTLRTLDLVRGKKKR